MAEQRGIVCLPVKEDNMDSVVPGSEQTNCAICTRRVWISPNGLTQMRVEHMTVICMPCAEQITADGQAEHVGTLPGAMEAAAEHFGVTVEEMEARWEAIKRARGWPG